MIKAKFHVFEVLKIPLRKFRKSSVNPVHCKIYAFKYNIYTFLSFAYIPQNYPTANIEKILSFWLYNILEIFWGAFQNRVGNDIPQFTDKL